MKNSKGIFDDDTVTLTKSISREGKNPFGPKEEFVTYTESSYLPYEKEHSKIVAKFDRCGK